MFRTLILIALFTPAVHALDPPEYTEAARLVQQQHWQEALVAIDRALTSYPHNAKLLNLDGLALIGASRLAEARAVFERALEGSPDFLPALKNLSIVEWNTGVPKASEDTEAALKLNPRDLVLNAYGAVAAIGRNDRERASERLVKADDALAVLPLSLANSFGLQLAEHGLYPQAVSVFQGIIKAGADSAALRYNLALAQFRAERYKDSIQTLEPLRSHTPASDAMNLLGQAYDKSGDTQKAVDSLREAISIDPKDENNYLDLSNVCTDNNLLDKAIAIVQTGLNYRPDSGRLNFQAGLLWVLSRHFDRAQAAFERAALLEPQNDLPPAGIELANLQQTRLADAIAGLRREVKEKPSSGLLWYLLGTALTRGGVADGSAEQQEAASAYRTALRVDPSLPWPYVELGKIYLRLKRPREAAPLFEKAILLNTKATPAYYQLARAFRELNEPQRSRDMLAKVRELNARDHGSSTPAQQPPDDH